MQMRALGNSGLSVCAIGPGCMGLSANYGQPVDEAPASRSSAPPPTGASPSSAPPGSVNFSV
jgi:hypothetical protein